MNELPNEILSKIKQIDYFTAISNPVFLEIEGLVVLESHYTPRSFEQWKRIIENHSSPEELERIENAINHVHLNDIVETPDLQKLIGEYLVAKWKKALLSQFPSKSFECHLSLSKNEWELAMWAHHS